MVSVLTGGSFNTSAEFLCEKLAFVEMATIKLQKLETERREKKVVCARKPNVLSNKYLPFACVMANDRKRIFCTREFLRVRDFWRNEKNIAEMPWELKGVSASNSKDAKNSFAFVLGDAY